MQETVVYGSNLTLYPMMYNSTRYYGMYINDSYWANCSIVSFMNASARNKVSHLFYNLFPSKA